MATAAGEERLLTLFADAHYYFVEPSPRPLHHRFDKASYVYLYWDSADQLARLEIANHAGTPSQDAFTGYLDSTKIRQSYKQPTLCTLTVDGHQRRSGPHPKASSDQNHWRLPSTDPRDEGRYLFHLHTIDLYFWTVQDAEKFMSSAQKTLELEQVEISDKPQALPTQKQYEAPPQTSNSTLSAQTPLAPHKDIRSPVVQQLENIAISDPGYQNGQTRDSRGSTLPKLASPYDDHRSPDPRSSMPPPPSAQQQQDSRAAEAHTPLAYNPAAPPAPEPIRHREKTPPPVEGAAGTGLAAAALNDHIHETAAPQSRSSFIPPPPPPGQQHLQQPYAPGPPRSHHGSTSGSAYGSPAPPQTYPPSSSGGSTYALSNANSLTPQQSHSSRTSYTPVPPSTAQAAPAAPLSSNPLSHHTSPPPQNPYAPQPQRQESYDPTLPSPATEILGPSFSPPQASQPLQHLQPQYADYLASHTPPTPSNPAYQSTAPATAAPPPGGYSNYDYAAQQQQQQQQQQQPARHGSQHYRHQRPQDDYDPHAIHSQVYRPTEDEAHAAPARRKTSTSSGRLDQGVDKVEKKVGGFLKRLEKRIG